MEKSGEQLIAEFLNKGGVVTSCPSVPTPGSTWMKRRPCPIGLRAKGTKVSVRTHAGNRIPAKRK